MGLPEVFLDETNFAPLSALLACFFMYSSIVLCFERVHGQTTGIRCDRRAGRDQDRAFALIHLPGHEFSGDFNPRQRRLGSRRLSSPPAQLAEQSQNHPPSHDVAASHAPVSGQGDGATEMVLPSWCSKCSLTYLCYVDHSVWRGRIHLLCP